MLTYGATDKEIKAAYRKLSIELHPDKNPDQSEEDAHRFKQVCSRMLAYACVCLRMLAYPKRTHNASSRCVHVCSRILTFARVSEEDAQRFEHVCSRMLTYAHVCSRKQVTQGYKILSDPEKKKRWLNHEAVDDKGIPVYFFWTRCVLTYADGS